MLNNFTANVNEALAMLAATENGACGLSMLKKINAFTKLNNEGNVVFACHATVGIACYVVFACRYSWFCMLYFCMLFIF